jgi:subfamily B ATP-binding cassette protein MsbA
VALRFRPHSYAAQDADELADRYADALQEVVHVLAVDALTLPSVTVYVTDSHHPFAPTTDAADRPPGGLVIQAVHAPEAPCPAPELGLVPALLSHYLGAPTPAASFWDMGLAGCLAGRSGRCPYHADASARCRQAATDGLLPSIEELVGEAGTRVSALTASAASAFVTFLIDRFGMARYRRLLVDVRRDSAHAFRRVYGRPLALVDRDWRRCLDTSAHVGQPSTWNIVRLLLPLARPHWRSGLIILLYTLGTIGFSLALPLAFRFLIDDILGQRPLGGWVPLVGPAGHVIAAGQQQLTVLIELMAFLGLLYLLNAAARLGLATRVNALGEAFVLDLRKQMLDILGRLPAAYFARSTTADVNQRVVYDTAAVQSALVGALIPLVASLLTAGLYASVLVALQPRLALVAALGLPLLALMYRLRRRNLRVAARERARRLSALSAGVTELAAAQVLVKIYAAAPYLLDRLFRRLETHYQLNVAYARESSMVGQTATLIVHLIQIAVLLVGGYIVVESSWRELGPGGLAAFYVLLNQLFGPVGQIASTRQSLTDASASLERVFGVLSQPTEQEPPDGIELGPPLREIRFESVSFAYRPEGRSVLKRLSLAIPSGATVAFVGPTGAGKSSLVNLLTRLHDPSRGAVTWDGVDVRQATLASLRGQVGFVPQDSFLLSASVYENIRFGLKDATEADVERAARLAQAHDFIVAMPDGYDSVVGEGGAGLSGGQRQRVALARALLRRPSVLILDEATSSLDASTQRALQEGLRVGAEGRTIVKIAHRLETVADADVIFVLDDGRLVEQGRHADLIAANGLYARLLEDQMSVLAAAGQPVPRQAVRWLARVAPFARLSPATLDDLVTAVTRIERRDGELIAAQGSEPDDLFVVGRGRVDMLLTDESGQERIVNTLNTGDAFGVSGFVSRQPRATSARAATDVILFVLSYAAFEAALERHAEPVQVPGLSGHKQPGRTVGP